jgi:outer membrane protein TolC
MKKIIATYILIFSSCGLLWSQETLTLEQCREIAIQNSKRIAIAESQIKQAEAEKKSARAMYLPNISGSVNIYYRANNIEEEIYLPIYEFDPLTGTINPDIAINPLTGSPIVGEDGNPVFNSYAYFPVELSLRGAYMAGVNLEQPLFTGGKIHYGNKMAETGIEMANVQVQLCEQELIQETDKLYWLLISVNEKYNLALEARDMLKEILDFVNTNYEVGMIHQNEVLKVEVEYNKALLNVQKAKSGLELTSMALCRILGFELNTKLTLSDSIIDVRDQILLNEKEKLESRPEVQLMNKLVIMEQHKVKMTRGDYLPVAGISCGYSHIGGMEFNNEKVDNGGTSIMGSLSIPLFHWGEGYYKINSAKEVLKQKELEKNENLSLMRLEVEQCRHDLKNALLRISLAEKALKQTEINRQISKDNYEAGMIVLTDLLLAQTQWTESYAELIEAKAEYKIKESNFRKAAGLINQ